MSELDLGATAHARPPPRPPRRPPPAALVLAPPAPVPVVEEEQAAGAIPVDDAKQTELQQQGGGVRRRARRARHRARRSSPRRSTSITSMGDKDMRASANVSNRMLDRPAAAMQGEQGRRRRRRADPGRRARWSTCARPSPTSTRTGPTSPASKKILKWLPGGDKIQRYFAKYESAQSHLNAIIKALDSGQDELRKDNAAIETEKANMWTTMGKLSEYNAARRAPSTTRSTQKVAELEAAGRTEDANTLKSDALFAIRQRRQDIMTQMAVSVQGYMALDLVRKNNLELIKGVDRAQTTTIVGAAHRGHRLAGAVPAEAGARPDHRAEHDDVQPDRVDVRAAADPGRARSTSRRRAARSTSQKLQAAFDNVFQTMDAIDTFRAQAVDSMAQTVTALEGQIERAKPYLERTRRGEGAEQTAAAGPERLPE